MKRSSLEIDEIKLPNHEVQKNPVSGLTLRSTRTQPQAAGSCHPGSTFTSSSLISSAAAGPVSLFR